MATVVVVREITIANPGGTVNAVCDSFETAEKDLKSNFAGYAVEETNSFSQISNGLWFKIYKVAGVKNGNVILREFAFQQMELKTS